MLQTRRQVLGTLAAAGTATLVEPGEVLARLAADVACVGTTPAGELLGTLPLFRNKPQPQEFGVKISGSGLDARLITNLSILEPNSLITPNELAYIRTEIPAAAANHQGPWTLDANGLLARPQLLKLDDLATLSKKMGPHLFECSGNGNPSNFGLMSVAEWEGIPLAEVVARLKPAKDATAVLVSGYDHIGQVSQRSIVGASWVFPLADLDTLGAFLAIRMNGAPVPDDHGKPVRLAVPGWYGCAWIKWVNEIRLVGPDEPATTQMVEFANRTHQAAAVQVRARLHTRRHPDRRHSGAHRKTARPARQSTIASSASCGAERNRSIGWRFASAKTRRSRRSRSAPHRRRTPCGRCGNTGGNQPHPARTTLLLKSPDQSIPQRRLKSGYYMRQVKIDEI